MSIRKIKSENYLLRELRKVIKKHSWDKRLHAIRLKDSNRCPLNVLISDKYDPNFNYNSSSYLVERIDIDLVNKFISAVDHDYTEYKTLRNKLLSCCGLV